MGFGEAVSKSRMISTPPGVTSGGRAFVWVPASIKLGPTAVFRDGNWKSRTISNPPGIASIG